MNICKDGNYTFEVVVKNTGDPLPIIILLSTLILFIFVYICTQFITDCLLFLSSHTINSFKISKEYEQYKKNLKKVSSKEAKSS